MKLAGIFRIFLANGCNNFLEYYKKGEYLFIPKIIFNQFKY